MTRYRALPPEALAPPVRLDHFLIVYHRPSGQTHMLVEPAPEILAALGAGEADAGEVAARLSAEFDGVDADAVASHLAELAGLGLVDAA